MNSNTQGLCLTHLYTHTSFAVVAWENYLLLKKTACVHNIIKTTCTIIWEKPNGQGHFLEKTEHVLMGSNVKIKGVYGYISVCQWKCQVKFICYIVYMWFEDDRSLLVHSRLPRYFTKKGINENCQYFHLKVSPNGDFILNICFLWMLWSHHHVSTLDKYYFIWSLLVALLWCKY